MCGDTRKHQCSCSGQSTDAHQTRLMTMMCARGAAAAAQRAAGPALAQSCSHRRGMYRRHMRKLPGAAARGALRTSWRRVRHETTHALLSRAHERHARHRGRASGPLRAKGTKGASLPHARSWAARRSMSARACAAHTPCACGGALAKTVQHSTTTDADIQQLSQNTSAHKDHSPILSHGDRAADAAGPACTVPLPSAAAQNSTAGMRVR